MPLNGGGTASRVPGTSAAPNQTIKSADYNSEMDDVYNILNTARPVAYGGTGATDAAGARANLGAAGLADANTFTKTQTWSKGADVASAATLTLGDDGNYFDITGTTTITAIATKGVGTVVKLHFDAALTLTHHSTDLVLPDGVNITTAAGDEAEFIEYASGDWRLTSYTPRAAYLFSVLGSLVPAKPQVAAGVGQVQVLNSAPGNGLSLPSGGTWFAAWLGFNSGQLSSGFQVAVAAGGTQVQAGSGSVVHTGFCWRIA